MNIEIKSIVEERLEDYKLPSMLIAFPSCSFKCEKECGDCHCHNSSLALQKNISVSIDYILSKYLKNKLTKAIICGGLEPFDSFSALYNLIKTTRDTYHCSDTIVIYTGYNKEEIQDKIHLLKPFGNIVCKFGRYVPNGQKHFDQTLGVDLASNNQYAEVIS